MHIIKRAAKKTVTVVKKNPIESAIIVMLVMAMSYAAIPVQTVLAAQGVNQARATALAVSYMQNATKEFGTFPDSKLVNPSYTIVVPATAYNSEPGQTDDTPFTTAWQTPVRDGIIAANFLPFGTKVKIPDLYGDKIFIVEDRMNARYDKRIDIWMEHHGDAIKFGLRNVKLEIYE